ncbi:MAG: DUF2190 family protein [Actinomycetota bacterium]|nr:DUF2190 family protein [Actinomycetota bacterium]
MAEYLPIFKPGQAVTLKASAAITGGQVVAVSGPNTVAPAGAGSTAVVGVAGFDAATNDQATIYSGGVQNCNASGAITAGSPVIAGAAGTVVASAAPPAGQQVGVALTTAADAAKVRIQFAR